MTERWAPDNAEGLHPYLIVTSQFGRKWNRIEYASSLPAAKAQYGWTREQHTRVSVRRATPADISDTK